ncbi:36182_t:CDS:2, partial [Racocetra persica]
MAPKPIYKKKLNLKFYYQQYFTNKLKDEYNLKEPFSNQILIFHIEIRKINDQKKSEFKNNFRDGYNRDYFFTAVRQYTKRNRVKNSNKGKSDEDELALSKDYPSTSAQDPLNKIPILQQESDRLDLDNQNLNDQNLIRKSNIYQTTEKAYEELKIEYGVLVKNLKDLEINHKNTKKELKTATKENTNLDKKLTLNKQELATANKENVNLDKKLSLKEQELETTNRENANLDKKLSIKEQELESAKKENANLDKKFTLKKQELETAKKEIMNLDKKLSIDEKELEAAKKENANLNKKLTEKEYNYEESQTKIKDHNKKIKSLKKE